MTTQQVEPTVTITVKEYESLLSNSLFLECLQGCGVDNWSGYDYAQEMFDESKGGEV